MDVKIKDCFQHLYLSSFLLTSIKNVSASCLQGLTLNCTLNKSFFVSVFCRSSSKPMSNSAPPKAVHVQQQVLAQASQKPDHKTEPDSLEERIKKDKKAFDDRIKAEKKALSDKMKNEKLALANKQRAERKVLADQERQKRREEERVAKAKKVAEEKAAKAKKVAEDKASQAASAQ